MRAATGAFSFLDFEFFVLRSPKPTKSAAHSGGAMP
jgi:hypothetical protein